MRQIQLNDTEIINDSLFHTPVKRKAAPRKWREIENIKAQLLLAKELREIDSSFSLSESEIA
ncbi:DUF3545 family protein [Psychromonas sp. RZ22]|uniref:DUF3545 family protein n=1 Tax=Psychromonas algarum TaxID=2555643 RepID=UPI0010676281|nr:DUF3545 family protein [Psychromonas sp. RZ22]TEW53461.1 DUF3545 family protein [Psychromonas sp. RZ22]